VRTTEILRQADASSGLPRLGGMARPNGVVIALAAVASVLRRELELV
jgi:hypothetical protein